jgi:hypothetical protein
MRILKIGKAFFSRKNRRKRNTETGKEAFRNLQIFSCSMRTLKIGKGFFSKKKLRIYENPRAAK